MNIERTRIVFPEKGRSELTVDSVDTLPGPGQVSGRSLFSLVSSGTEVTGLMSGNLAGIEYPAYPGYATVFEIEIVGSDVEGTSPGDIAFCMGHHQSHQIVDVEKIVPVPPGLPISFAPLARLMAVSMTTLVTTTARPGDTVVVSGLGPVGLLAALMFKRSGYTVIGVDPIDRRREEAMKRGISGVMPLLVPETYSREAPALVVECSGKEEAVIAAAGVVRPGGEVVLVGVPWRKESDVAAHELLYEVFHRYVVLRSGWEWELPRRASHFGQVHTIYGNIERAMEWLLEWCGNSTNSLEELVEIVPVGTAPVVYDDILQRRREKLLTVFEWEKGT